MDYHLIRPNKRVHPWYHLMRTNKRGSPMVSLEAK